MNSATLHSSLLSAALFIILLRVFTLDAGGLIDTTEGRYAAISQEMASSGDWITPIIQIGEEKVPYLGKPPLYFWIGALCLELFGNDEWSARLPSLLAALLAVYLLYLFAGRFLSKEDGALSILISFSSLFFFFLSGAAVVDMVLTACVVGGIVTATFATEGSTTERKHSPLYFGLLFFTFCALGFLTKGPIALIFIGVPLTLWSVLRKDFSRWWCLPWLYGLPLFLVLTVPWFLLAERESPGFLKYFFVNENFLRFLTKNYADRFGSGHVYTYGSVWIAFIVGTVPWILFLPYFWHKALPFGRCKEKGLLSYVPAFKDPGASHALLLLIAGITPCLIFTFGRQFSPLYVLPGIPTFALSVAWLMRILSEKDTGHNENFTKFFANSTYTVIGLIGIGIVVTLFLGAPPLVGLLTAIGAMFIILKLHQLTLIQAPLLNRVGLFAVAIVVFYSSITLGSDPYLSRKRSTRAIIESILATHPSGNITIGVPFGDFGNPFSVWFYDNAQDGARYEVKSIDETTLEPVPKIIILKTQDLKNIQKYAESRGYKLMKSLGRWSWFERA